MNSITLLHEYHADENPPLIIERFLRDREGVWRQIKQEYQLNALIGQMLKSSTIALVGYGAVMGAGASSGLLQSLSSAIKLPILFLLTLAICLPPRSDQRIWLRAFLNELREIMDTAYRVALISQVYGQPEQLERLVDEVREIEAGVAEHVMRRMLAHDGDAHDELLAGRMATLRLCMRELASLAEARVPIAS
jgi:hypothetical protein